MLIHFFITVGEVEPAAANERGGVTTQPMRGRRRGGGVLKIVLLPEPPTYCSTIPSEVDWFDRDLQY